MVSEGSAIFAPKNETSMSNPAFTSVVFEGDRRQLRSLYGKMKRLQERRRPLLKNGFRYPERWLGNLVARLGGSWRDVECRGTWDELGMEPGRVVFFTETAWNPPLDLLKFVRQRYPLLTYLYMADGDGWCMTNDSEGRIFKSRYIVDCEPDIEYFNSIEEACAHLSAFTGLSIAPSWPALCAAAEEWNAAHEDADWPVNVIEVEMAADD